MEEHDVVSALLEKHPGYEKLVSQLFTLISTYPPPFIYINDITTVRITSSVVHSVLETLSMPTSGYPRVSFAHVHGVACFTPRLLFDSVLNSLAGWDAKWEDGCENWSADGAGKRWNESLDGFLHGLRALSAFKVMEKEGKGKEKDVNDTEDQARMVLVVDCPERLKETSPGLIVPLTRLAELSEVDITTVFVSGVRWEDIRPSLGASPDPYFIDITIPDKEAVITRLISSFTALSTSSDHPAYQPVLQPLYEHFASVLYSICSVFTQDPNELAYISAARWPGFIQPVLDQHNLTLENGMESVDSALEPPTEDTRMRLTRLFTPSFTAALEALYPRLTNAADWAAENASEGSVVHVSRPRRTSVVAGAEKDNQKDNMGALPRMAKFILLASFLASRNPPRSDLRMFGRGLDEKKRKRRKGGGPRKSTGKNGPAKIPQRLAGPAIFSLDRMIAILGALLEENDVDNRLPNDNFTLSGEYTETEIGRVQVYALITELTSMRLLHRTSAFEKFDVPLTFKSGISYNAAMRLARQLDVPLNDLMWDPL